MTWIITLSLCSLSCVLGYFLGHGLGQRKGFDEGWESCIIVMKRAMEEGGEDGTKSSK